MPISHESVPNQSPDDHAAGGGSVKGKRHAPQHLRDMRRVYKLPASADETAAQKSMRKVMVEDFTKFMGMLQAAERQHAAGKRPHQSTGQPADPSAPVAEEEDEGTEAALAVYERCLRDFQLLGGK